ncbi:hypothetical protein UNDYM_4103 [Undibacterium sp. YM2]|uniref:hypothetical protein n=1 Tax=Undibacterium sp. YM2 TaxID=2058625 RepID=UPI001331CE28|nr:hypothetical protein [Undibacterium sp. YM2]BBB68356.1 hypothetical protein UNDYM_4103 [Undibacterium sp. YM2]
METEIIFKVCMQNMLRVLSELKADPALENTKRIDLAIGFAKEIELLWPPFPDQLSERKKDIGSDADSTNYETYKLLKSFGLTLEELVQVAKSEGLPELRIVRMVRLVYDIGLDEAGNLLRNLLELKMLKGSAVGTISVT